MKGGIALLAVLLWWLAAPAWAHRLDENLQATTIDVHKDYLSLQLRLTPGVAVARQVLAHIDRNGNGAISDTERQAYSEQVQHSLALTLDGHSLPLRLDSSVFPKAEEIPKGLSDIVLQFDVAMPTGSGLHRFRLEHHDETLSAVYLVNCLLPRDPAIHIIGQQRNADQSAYQLDCIVDPGAAPFQDKLSGLRRWLEQTGDLPVAGSYFRHGIRHILTGYDHLLFACALVLAVTTFWDLVKIVTAFTFAHSITLTLAALNLVHLPGMIVEPLISVSIVFIALQNLFWPKSSQGRSRLLAAFFFGLFHGLGFAGGLLEMMHNIATETVLAAIMGFSLGVEAGHQVLLIPLFGVLKIMRRFSHAAPFPAHLLSAFQRIGSTGIAMAGTYYLCVALTSNT